MGEEHKCEFFTAAFTGMISKSFRSLYKKNINLNEGDRDILEYCAHFWSAELKKICRKTGEGPKRCHKNEQKS